MFNILEDKKQAEAIATSAARECEAIIKSWADYEDFVLANLTLDWSTRRRSSRGGWYASGPGINIAMAAAATIRTEPYRLYEYKSFDSDPVIGGFFARDPSLAVQLHVCHEMAHAAQFYAKITLGKSVDRPHGDSFKAPYRILRAKYLNPKLPPNQKQLQQEYNEVISSILRGNQC